MDTLKDRSDWIRPAGVIAQSAAGPLPLPDIRQRIYDAQKRVTEISVSLSNHADRLFYAGDDACAQDAAPLRAGEIGGIQDALDRLECAISELAAQADRNTRLV